MPFPADEAKIVSIFIQTLLYGAYAVLFILTMWVLLTRRRKVNPWTDPMLWISLAMFVVATMHIGVNYTRIIKAFIIYRNEPGGPAAFFNELSEFTQIFGSTLYIAQTLIGDSVVLLRCYLVWGTVWVVMVPFVLLLGSTASGIGILYSFAKVVPQADIFVNELQNWITSFFSLTLATNIICTSLVALRIWWINRSIMTFVNHSYYPIIFLVLESGAVYSATLTVLIILYKTDAWFQYVLLDAISPIVGLVFSMIIIRIGLGITTARGSSGSNTADRQTTFDRRIPISFAPPTRNMSTLDDVEYNADELQLQDVSTRSQDLKEQKQTSSVVRMLDA
ncbi:uncharacterized protein C8Q71DRAFT_577470 [Rhodofomes roseus]|uniref:Uncharacterized protein n=1 Tax=Rhodofomes roseus TaxID=34475 RepID=A0ABQ8KJ99_9APHY|nr:uncharacterized protein C8Q71DRAFT_577470 [Rhodofomes roseus]KAH9838082.1 hypothetical protein C8Q71DRAFT_577470 [Rhodofomes roseus]